MVAALTRGLGSGSRATQSRRSPPSSPAAQPRARGTRPALAQLGVAALLPSRSRGACRRCARSCSRARCGRLRLRVRGLAPPASPGRSASPPAAGGHRAAARCYRLPTLPPSLAALALALATARAAAVAARAQWISIRSRRAASRVPVLPLLPPPSLSISAPSIPAPPSLRRGERSRRDMAVARLWAAPACEWCRGPAAPLRYRLTCPRHRLVIAATAAAAAAVPAVFGHRPRVNLAHARQRTRRGAAARRDAGSSACPARPVVGRRAAPALADRRHCCRLLVGLLIFCACERRALSAQVRRINTRSSKWLRTIEAGRAEHWAKARLSSRRAGAHGLLRRRAARLLLCLLDLMNPLRAGVVAAALPSSAARV